MREDVKFQTSDNITLRGWFYKPDNATSPLPTLILIHGFSCVKEIELDEFAKWFSSALPMNCLLYDHRGFGESDAKEGHPRQEIIPAHQTSDVSDAITYVQTRPDVIKDKVGLWGTSYGGGHAIWVGAVDRRVKVVVAQVPFVDGFANFHRLARPDFIEGLNKIFENDRIARAAGEPPVMMPVVGEGVHDPKLLPSAESFEFFAAWGKKAPWKNEATAKSLEAMREYIPASQIRYISPTPLLIIVAQNDTLCPSDITLEAYSKALEPKELCILPGGHFAGYSGPHFEKNCQTQAEFLKKHFLS